MNNLQRQQSKDEKRSQRLLKALRESSAYLEVASTGNTCLLVFDGQRTIKCQKHVVSHWINAGYVKLLSKGAGQHRQPITITQDGIAYLERMKSGDFADQHRQIDAQMVEIAGVKQSVARNMNESPLSSLMRQTAGKASWLNSVQFSAGERLRSDFEFSQLMPRITSSWDPTASLGKSNYDRTSNDNMLDRVAGARQRLNRAIEAVGPEFSGILLDVCCFLKGMEQVERERQWPRRSAKLLLRAALSALARHYQPENAARASANIRQWGTADYRPKI